MPEAKVSSAFRRSAPCSARRVLGSSGNQCRWRDLEVAGRELELRGVQSIDEIVVSQETALSPELA